MGSVRFDPALGFVQVMHLKQDYKKQGYGREMVNNVRMELLTDDLWCVTYEGHPFWSKVPGATYMDPVDFDVEEGGYRFK